MTGDYNHGFQFGPTFKMCRVLFWPAYKAMIVDYFTTMVLVWLGYLACLLGVYVSLSLLAVNRAQMWAQIYELWLERGGDALPRPDWVGHDQQQLRQVFE